MGSYTGAGDFKDCMYGDVNEVTFRSGRGRVWICVCVFCGYGFDWAPKRKYRDEEQCALSVNNPRPPVCSWPESSHLRDLRTAGWTVLFTSHQMNMHGLLARRSGVDYEAGLNPTVIKWWRIDEIAVITELWVRVDQWRLPLSRYSTFVYIPIVSYLTSLCNFSATWHLFILF